MPLPVRDGERNLEGRPELFAAQIAGPVQTPATAPLSTSPVLSAYLLANTAAALSCSQSPRNFFFWPRPLT